MQEEVFVGFQCPRSKVPVCTHVRTTLIGASIMALRQHNLFEKYDALLPAKHKSDILYAVAGQWIPVDLAVVHYAACDAMGIPTADVVRNGSSVSLIAQKTMFSLIIRLAANGGLTPWTMLSNGRTYWERSYQGSALGIFKVGPKEARLEVAANPLARIAYWRSSFQGIITVLGNASAGKCYVREVLGRSDSMDVTYRMSWV